MLVALPLARPAQGDIKKKAKKSLLLERGESLVFCSLWPIRKWYKLLVPMMLSKKWS